MRTLLALLFLNASLFAAPVPLFDGKSLDGWQGDPKLWRVEDGMITGGSLTEKVTHNDFVATAKSYANFELRVKIKLSGTEGFINSGVQIRSVRVPGSPEMSGYQVDYGKGWYGKLYDESRRNKVVAESKNLAAATAAIKEGDWNEYRIRAEGPRIQSWINGVPALDYTEAESFVVQDGQIGIQVHGGGKALVQVKEVTIEELPQTSPLKIKVEGAELAPPGLAAAAVQTLTTWYPRIRHILGSDYDTASEVTLRFHDFDGVAHTSAGTIEASTRYFAKHPNDVGALLHELVHVVQGYPPGAPGWLVEGVADYVRYYYFEPAKGAAFRVQPGDSYKSGYNPAAALVASAQVGKPKAIVAELNRLGHTGKLNEATFKEVVGQTPDEVWARVPGNKPTAAAPAAAKGGRDISYNAVQSGAKTPDEERATFKLPEGFEAQLVAAESEGIGKFVPIAFDQHGALWTTTAFEYPVDGNENPAAADALYASKAKDRVLVFDRDPQSPTGLASKPRIFADGLAIPLGVLPYKNGCYVQHGHDIAFLEDTDGDGRADKRTVTLTGFGVQDSHLFPHQFLRAPGGWIWMAQGAFNYSKVARPGDEQHAVQFDQTRMAKFRPDGSEFTITSNGPCNIWGLVLNGVGEAFIQEANDFGYPVMPFHEFANYPGCSDRQWKSYAPEFPGTAPDFRMGGTGLSGLALLDEGWAKLLEQTRVEAALPANAGVPPPSVPAQPHPQAVRPLERAASTTQTVLVANPITNRIQGIKMHRDGPYWKLDKPVDFLVSDDPWFRPVAITIGPDGCLYIVDWYNKIISHNEVPRNHPDRDKTRGRIWRVVAKGAKRFEVPDFTKLSGDELIAKLGGDSLAQNHLAWQAIADRGMKELAPKLKATVADATKTGNVRIGALWALESVAELFEAGDHFVAEQLVDLDRNLRREIVRALSGQAKMMNPSVYLNFILYSLPDSDPEVRFEAIRAEKVLLETDDADVSPIMNLLARDIASLPGPLAPSTKSSKPIKVREAYDREFERYLIRMLLEQHPKAVAHSLDLPGAGRLSPDARLLASLALEPKASAPRVAKLLPHLQRAPDQEEVLRLAQFPEEPGVGEALHAILSNRTTRDAALAALLATRTKLDAAKLRPLLSEIAAKLLASKDADEVATGVKLAGSFQLAGVEAALEDVIRAEKLERHDYFDGEPGHRTYIKLKPNGLAALRALRDLHSDKAALFEWLLRFAEGAEVHDEALAALAASRAADAPQRLLAIYPKFAPEHRRQALDKLCVTKSGAGAIVAAIEAGTVPKEDIDAATLDRLLAVLGDKHPALAKIVDRLGALFRPVLTLDGSEEAWTQTNLSFDGPLTVETWIFLNPQGRKIGNADGILGVPGKLDINFFDAKLRVWVGGNIHDVIVAKKPIAANLWTHVAAVRDEAGRWRLYIDGELDNAESKAAVPGPLENARIAWTGAKGGTQGTLAEYRLWNRARTADEIRRDFDRSLEVWKPDSSLKGGVGNGLTVVSAPNYRLSLRGGDAQSWGTLQKGARATKTSDLPPILTVEQATALDAKFSKYRALAAQPGDAARGKLAATLCMTCHLFGKEGGNIGPVLSSVGAMGTEAILRNIVTPNAAMENGYRTYRVEKTDGSLLEAFFVSEDKDAVVVRLPGAGDQRVERKDIRATKYLRRSLMPEGLLDTMTDQQASDLFTYLMSLK